MIADPSRHSEIISLIQQLPTIQIEEIVKKHVHKLVRIDASGFTSIIVTRLGDQIDKILESVEDDRECEYALLTALYSNTDSVSNKREPGSSEEEKSFSPVKLELSQRALTRLLMLMCDFEPNRVTFFLHFSNDLFIFKYLKSYINSKMNKTVDLGNYLLFVNSYKT